MAANDVSPSLVFGESAGIYQGSALPTAITSSADYFIVIKVSEARSKANQQGITLINSAKLDSTYDTATDIGHLILTDLYSFSVLNSKSAPVSSLRKFDCAYYGWNTDNNSFETGKAFTTYPFNVTFYRELTGINDAYDSSVNTLS